MTQKQKVNRIEKKFAQIQDLFPGKSISLEVHGINMDELTDKWIVSESRTETGHDYKSAKRINKEFFDITLFD